MNKIKVISALVLGISGITTNYAAGIEMELRALGGARLELIERAAEGSVVVNDVDSLSLEDRADFGESFNVIPLSNSAYGYLSRGFYLLDGNGAVKKFLYAEEREGVLMPGKNGEAYLSCSLEVSNFSGRTTLPIEKALYSIDGALRWQRELKGYVYASDDLSTVGVFSERGATALTPNFNTFSSEGSITSENKTGCTFPVTVSRDGEIVAFAERDALSLPSLPKGTRVFDKSGTLLFTLDPNYLADVGTGTHKPKVLYASGKYIIQLCHRITRLPTDPPKYYDGQRLEAMRHVDGGIHYLQVYDRGGLKKWEVGFEGMTSAVSFAVSDNDEYVVVHVPRDPPRDTARCDVFELETGIKQYEFAAERQPRFGLTDLGISNDGSTVYAVHTLDSSQSERGLRKSAAVIYSHGEKTARCEAEYDYTTTDGDIGVIFSNAGGFAGITADRGFSIYKLTLPEG